MEEPGRLQSMGLQRVGHDWGTSFFASVWDECNCEVVWTFSDIAFLWDWNENWPFAVLWALLSFPYLLTHEFSTFTASSFMIWNSSTGIPSPPPALFIVFTVHLTLFLSTLIFAHISGSSSNVNFSIKFFLISQVDLTYACVLFPEKQFIELWPRTGWQEMRSRLCRVQSTGIYL